MTKIYCPFENCNENRQFQSARVGIRMAGPTAHREVGTVGRQFPRLPFLTLGQGFIPAYPFTKIKRRHTADNAPRSRIVFKGLRNSEVERDHGNNKSLLGALLLTLYRKESGKGEGGI